MSGVDAIVERLVTGAAAGDTIALLSNGAFGGIHRKLLDALGRSKEGRSR
jgi:UDP-N-acetylmuramate: L-alanyl-gamma-D-glutamyl-meso-diaminopimelate ligase